MLLFVGIVLGEKSAYFFQFSDLFPYFIVARCTLPLVTQSNILIWGSHFFWRPGVRGFVLPALHSLHSPLLHFQMLPLDRFTFQFIRFPSLISRSRLWLWPSGSDPSQSYRFLYPSRAPSLISSPCLSHRWLITPLSIFLRLMPDSFAAVTSHTRHLFLSLGRSERVIIQVPHRSGRWGYWHERDPDPPLPPDHTAPNGKPPPPSDGSK